MTNRLQAAIAALSQLPEPQQDAIATLILQELAKVTHPEPKQPRPIGLCAGEFVVPDDFDAPLPHDILELFEGK